MFPGFYWRIKSFDYDLTFTRLLFLIKVKYLKFTIRFQK